MEKSKPTQMVISKVYAEWSHDISNNTYTNEFESFGTLIISLIEIGMTKLEAFGFVMDGYRVDEYVLEAQYTKETRLRAVWHAEDMGSSAGPDGSWFGDEYE
tara:strand:+ start:12415 stop:12720 length:306 start_codon:yes stop_codon:yes gene_type:complete